MVFKYEITKNRGLSPVCSAYIPLLPLRKALVEFLERAMPAKAKVAYQ